uniref:Reverse transcriptase n=1 Tax=Cannabis sativa TaxID=3483 RepID=A0A803QBY9_CANSA
MCFEIVRDCYENGNDENLFSKFARCANKLSVWGNKVTGNFKVHISRCKKELQRLANRRDTASIQRHKEVNEELFHVLDQREAFWKQRSKQLWLKQGDHNSSYFHKAATTRKRHNKIVSLKNENGVRVGWDNGLSQVMIDYFTTLFQASNLSCPEVINCVNSSVLSFLHDELRMAVSEEEVKRAIFQMHPDKSLGSDGMTPGFYQKCWSIVGRDVVAAVQSFFLTGKFELGCSKANIVLVTVNRMKPYMNAIVGDTQSAFILGRLISDNILISFEVLHYLKRKRKGKDGFMALKLDMSKAYDRIKWPFLEIMLRKLSFDQWWIFLLMKCVTSAQYMVVHENKEMGPIIPSRGIRQRDPLSSYLFILCAEGLSALLYKYERAGLIHGCKVANGAPCISHMLFADHSYLYCKATILEATRIKDILLKNKFAVLGYLKERVRKRIEGWETKFLSRAGKEVLIKTVAQSLPSYVMSISLLPLDITRDMHEQILVARWNSSEDDHTKFWTKSWKLKNPPKSEELGLACGRECLPTLQQLKWKNAQNSRIETWSSLQVNDGAEHWAVPNVNNIKVNVDAAFFDSGNKYGCGLVARDHYGMLIEGKMMLFSGSVTPEVAESIGIQEAFSWIKSHNCQHVTLEADCLTVVQALRSTVDMISLFGQVIHECKKLLLELKTIYLLFVKRSANMVAHNCARASIFYPGCIFDMESAPFDLLPSLVADFDG